MLGLTSDEMKSSMQAMELVYDGRNLLFKGSETQRLRVAFRMQEPHQLLYLARLIAHLGYEEKHFLGARFWVTAWGIWNPMEEAIALKTLEQVRRSLGENRSIESASGMYFRHDEFVESVCCLLQPMLVGWDAFYVPTWAYGHLDYFVAVSHDSFVDIEVRTPEMREKAVTILAEHEWIKPLIQ